MVDNREIIKRMIIRDFEQYQNDEQHIFYIVQVLCRKKDGCEKDNYPVYQKTIDNIDKIDKIFDEAIIKAHEYNARVYITVSPKVKEKTYIKIANVFLEQLLKNQYDKSIESIVYGASMMSGNSCCKRIIFDFDGYNIDDIVLEFFEAIGQPYFHINTVNGFHIITEMTRDFMGDDIFDLMGPYIKELIKNVYYYNNGKHAVNIKQAFKDMMHKESGNILVYYKTN